MTDTVESAVEQAVQAAEQAASAAFQKQVDSLWAVVKDHQARLDDLPHKGHRKALVECP
jgi:hypothetical protein